MKQVNYQFRQELLEVHKPQRAMPWAKPGGEDVLVDARWSIWIPEDADPILYNAARDLEDYFAVSMNVYIPVTKTRASAFQIRYLPDKTLKEREYRVIVEEGSILLTGATSKNCARPATVWKT